MCCELEILKHKQIRKTKTKISLAFGEIVLLYLGKTTVKKFLLLIVMVAGVSTRVVQTSKNTALLPGSDCLVGSHLSTTQTRAYVTVSVTLSFLVWSVARHPYNRKIKITFMFNV